MLGHVLYQYLLLLKLRMAQVQASNIDIPVA